MWPWIALAALLVLLWLAFLLWLGLRLRARLRLPDREPLAPLSTHYPIVLVHGYCGFEKLGDADYFRGIRPALENSGAAVHVPVLPPLSGVAARARVLAEAVTEICERTGATRVNIIAHSMGGLDSRYAIAKLGLGVRVAALITVGTPHWGTPVADAAKGLGVSALVAVAGGLGFDIAAVRWMTADGAERFNREIADVDGVFYASVVGRAGGKAGPLRRYVENRGGESDGLVPVSSQSWGEVIAEIEADHWQQIGWSNGFDAVGLYAELIERLRERGL